jgi:hypothetical protein
MQEKASTFNDSLRSQNYSVETETDLVADSLFFGSF